MLSRLPRCAQIIAQVLRQLHKSPCKRCLRASPHLVCVLSRMQQLGWCVGGGPQGEITLVIEGQLTGSRAEATPEEMAAAVQAYLSAGHSASATAKLVSAELGISKRLIYNLAVQLSQQLGDETHQP